MDFAPAFGYLRVPHAADPRAHTCLQNPDELRHPPRRRPRFRPSPQADAFLQFLVNLVNNGGQLKSIGVTLQMGGMLVSGSIVSGAEYFDTFARLR